MDYYAEPDPDPPPPSPRRGGSGVMIAAVVILVLAAGGGAFAVVSSLTGNSTGGHPSGQPTSAAPTQPASSAPAATTTAPASHTAPASPSASKKASTVAMSPSAAASHAAAPVRTLLERYFAAINAHNYAAYSSLLDAQMQQNNPQSKFASGYATTRDSAAKVTSIADTGGGGVAATVTFTSHQNPADSINNSSCTAWTITLYLQPQDGSYLIGVPPVGYRSIHQDCP